MSEDEVLGLEPESRPKTRSCRRNEQSQVSLPKIPSELAPACRSDNLLSGCLLFCRSSLSCSCQCAVHVSRVMRRSSFCGNSCSF